MCDKSSRGWPSTVATQEVDKAKMITDKIFEKFDTDNNQSIDKEEAKAIFIDVMKSMNATNLKVTD